MRCRLGWLTGVARPRAARQELEPEKQMGDQVRVVAKDVIRLAVGSDEGHAEIEIRVRQDRWDGWEARALRHENDGSSATTLGRVFRSRDRRLAVGKMIAWVRRRYGVAQPIIEHHGKAPVGATPPPGG